MEPHSPPDAPDTTGWDTGQPPAPPLPAVEAAAVAGVNERTIRRAITAGQLPATKHRGAFLRGQLDQRSRELAAERERFDVVQQLALQRIEALTATVADQREDAPTAAPEPSGRDEGQREGDRASWLSGAWRKVRGG